MFLFPRMANNPVVAVLTPSYPQQRSSSPRRHTGFFILNILTRKYNKNQSRYTKV